MYAIFKADTIIKNKPILLLSAYHKVSDLWESLYYLSNLNLGYKFYLCHYSNVFSKIDSVLCFKQNIVPN